VASLGQGKTKETTTQMQMEGELAATSAAGRDSRTGAQHGRVLPIPLITKTNIQHRIQLSIPIFSILDSFHFMYVSGLSFRCFSLDALLGTISNHFIYDVEGEISLPPS
jgi:hypothetical protein